MVKKRGGAGRREKALFGIFLGEGKEEEARESGRKHTCFVCMQAKRQKRTRGRENSGEEKEHFNPASVCLHAGWMESVNTFSSNAGTGTYAPYVRTVSIVVD